MLYPLQPFFGLSYFVEDVGKRGGRHDEDQVIVDFFIRAAPPGRRVLQNILKGFFGHAKDGDSEAKAAAHHRLDSIVAY